MAQIMDIISGVNENVDLDALTKLASDILSERKHLHIKCL